MAEYQSILGIGMNFPFQIDEVSGSVLKRVITIEDIGKIKDSIVEILGTKEGERFFNRKFGSKMHRLVFEPNDEIFAGLAAHYIFDALSKWERRIRLLNVIFEFNPDKIDLNRVDINLWFEVIKTQRQYNFVFPYYRGIPTDEPALTNVA